MLKPLNLARRIAVMGVVNVTPDSFYDQGLTASTTQAVAAAERLTQAGADVVDIGGLAFSPKAPDPGEAGERDRVLPVIAAAAADGAVVSVDTWRVGVAEAAIGAGASIINDTSGLADPAMADLAADTGAMLIITHSLAPPHTVLAAPPWYADVVAEVAELLCRRVDLALRRGVGPGQIILDPGHDLNKNTRHTLELTRRLEEIVALGYPVLAAVSNKDFIGETLGLPKEERLTGSLAAAAYCAAKGARMLRMHNVTEAVQVARLIEAINGWREPVHLRHNMLIEEVAR